MMNLKMLAGASAVAVLLAGCSDLSEQKQAVYNDIDIVVKAINYYPGKDVMCPTVSKLTELAYINDHHEAPGTLKRPVSMYPIAERKGEGCELRVITGNELSCDDLELNLPNGYSSNCEQKGVLEIFIPKKTRGE